MPKKYEHLVRCRLSKRQRYLYDDFMSKTKWVPNITFAIKQSCRNHITTLKFQINNWKFDVVDVLSWHYCDITVLSPFSFRVPWSTEPLKYPATKILSWVFNIRKGRKIKGKNSELCTDSVSFPLPPITWTAKPSRRFLSKGNQQALKSGLSTFPLGVIILIIFFTYFWPTALWPRFISNHLVLHWMAKIISCYKTH